MKWFKLQSRPECRRGIIQRLCVGQDFMCHPSDWEEANRLLGNYDSAPCISRWVLQPNAEIPGGPLDWQRRAAEPVAPVVFEEGDEVERTDVEVVRIPAGTRGKVLGVWTCWFSVQWSGFRGSEDYYNGSSLVRRVKPAGEAKRPPEQLSVRDQISAAVGIADELAALKAEHLKTVSLLADMERDRDFWRRECARTPEGKRLVEARARFEAKGVGK